MFLEIISHDDKKYLLNYKLDIRKKISHPKIVGMCRKISQPEVVAIQNRTASPIVIQSPNHLLFVEEIMDAEFKEISIIPDEPPQIIKFTGPPRKKIKKKKSKKKKK